MIAELLAKVQPPLSHQRMEIFTWRDTISGERRERRFHGTIPYNGATNMYVIRSSQQYAACPYGTYQITKKPTNKKEISSSPWLDIRQWKRRKRTARYKMYGIESKVKDSFKLSIRWIKRTCRKIAYGF